jgi:hypothetical protein
MTTRLPILIKIINSRTYDKSYLYIALISLIFVWEVINSKKTIEMCAARVDDFRETVSELKELLLLTTHFT